MLKAVLYDWGGLNVWLFHLINQWHAPFWDALMRLGTALGNHANFPVYLALAVRAGLLLTARGQRRGGQGAAGRLAVSWLGVLAVFSLGYVVDGGLIIWLKPWLNFPRPLLALPPGSVVVVGRPEYHHSLPSGHSAFAMLVAASLWPVLDKRWRAAAVAFVFWVGISRLSLGDHFPADVLAGWLLSLAVVGALRTLLRRVMQISSLPESAHG